MRAVLTNAEWLTGARAKVWVRPFALAILGYTAAACLLIGIASVGTKPPANDFAPFWVAGRLVLSGQGGLAYDTASVDLAERAATKMPAGQLPFYYPPSYLLLCAPLGLLGFVPAMVLFVAGQTALVLACLRRLVAREWGWLPLLAFPGFLLNALCGQNGAFSAACFGGAAIWLEERPILAGLCLSFLACKPQLGLCVPIALLMARRLRALLACGGGALALAVLSWLALGTGVWSRFFLHLAEPRSNLQHAIIWPKLQSMFGAVMLAGGSMRAATAAQAAIGVAAISCLALVAIRRSGGPLEMAALTTAALLVTPYLLDYDLAILAVPMACLARQAQQSGWQSYEKTVLLALFLLPLFARASGLLLGVTLGPALILALMVLICRRAGQAQRA